MKKFIPVILVVILVVGGLGWWFFIKEDEKPAANTAPESSQTTEEQQNELGESQADYKGEVVKSENEKFRLTIPNGWKTVTNCTSGDVVYINDSEAVMEYDEQTKPTIVEHECGDDSRKLFFVTVNSSEQAEEADDDAEDFTTTDGLEGTRVCKANTPGGGLAQETYLQACTYRFESGDSVYTVDYNRPDASYLDRTELVDRVVKSLVVQKP